MDYIALSTLVGADLASNSFEILEPEAEPLVASSSSSSPRRIGHRATSFMEKVTRTRIARAIDKLAVESEPGLTHAQLLLTNHDLKPGTLYLPFRPHPLNSFSRI